MLIKFWGTRGSLPSPLKPEEVEEKIYQAILGLPDIDVRDPDAVRAYVRGLHPLVRGTAGGNTPCVEILAGGETLIVDAGSGLRELGIELMEGPCGRGEGRIHILITHPHWDHIQGFPMFRPAFVPGNQIFIYGLHDLETAFEAQQRPLFWPVSLSYMQADLEFVTLQVGQPLSIGNVQVSTILSTHPGGSYSYRFEDQHCVLVHASDAEYKHLDPTSIQPYIDFFQNADALIFDAQYTLREAWQKVDWGHSSAMIGVDLARAAGVKKLIVFHHDPTYSDADLLDVQSRVMAYQVQDTSLPICEVLVAHEGMTLDLTPLGAVDLQFTRDGEATILTPIHTVDKHGAAQLALYLARSSEQTPSSIIDLSQVETLTTAGLKSLISLRQKHEGTPVVLAAPSDSIQRVIELGGYQDYFAIYPSVKAALAAVQASEASNLPGQVIRGRYQIDGKIGQGRLGTVLKATDIQTDSPVALKVLSPSFSQETLGRLVQQSRQIITLDHPNIAKVFSWDRDGVVVEEFATGQTLQQLLEEGTLTLSVDQTIDIAKDVARALEYAHSRGAIHGDLKPQNVFLTEDGAKVSGFGLGLLEQGRNLLDAPLLLLTAAYLAPEQILGQPLDARTDLYALGVILYQLLTGHLPFAGTDQEIMRAHLQDEPRPPSALNPQVSPSLEHLVLKLLAKNPNERYASAQQTRRISSSLAVRPGEVTFPRRSLLVGREKQLQALRACWEEARAGHGQLAFITGESGIGKTSLAQQVAAQSEAPVQLIGHCQERRGGPAYQLFTQVLQIYFGTVPPEFFDEEARQLCANFVRLVPEIRQMLPDLPDPSPLEPEHEQFRLMSSLTQFVRRATQERPWFLILDDLQWADPSSLELLRYLGRHLPSMPLMVIGAYRDVELERGHPLLETMRDLSRLPGYQHFPLGRLDQADVGQLLANLLQQPVPAALVDRIYQHTEGNPFYVEEAVRVLFDDGLITMQEGKWQFPELAEVRLPTSVREAVWHRIGRLSPDTQTLLSQAAVLGQSFRFDVLCEMSELSEWQVLEHLDMALERQLVQEVPGETLLRFRHAEIQHVLYADLGPLRCRMLHRQAGEVLERRALAETEGLAEELAHHFAESGEFERALGYSMQAARQAQAAYANEAALLWYNHALEMLDQLGLEEDSPYRALQLSAHQALGEVLSLVGRYDEALTQYGSARTLLESETTSTVQARRLAQLCHQTAEVYERRGQHDLALEWLEKGLSYLDEEDPTVEMVRIYISSGLLRLHQGYYDAAHVQLERALNLARTGGLNQEEADSLRRLGSVFLHLGDCGSARAYYEQALAIHREIGDRQGEASTLNNLGVVFSNQGDYGGARASYGRALDIYREIGDRQGEGGAVGNLGVVSDLLGNYAEARDYYQQALQICREIGDRRGEGSTLINLGMVNGSLGRYTEARAYSEQALGICSEIGYRRGEGLALHNLGLIFHHLGDYIMAQAYYEQSLRVKWEIDYRQGESRTLADLGLLSHHLGDHEAAREYSQQALLIARDLDDRLGQGRSLTYLGHALAGLGDLAAAVDAYRQAITIQRELGQHNLAMEPLAGLARIYMAQDGPSTGLRLGSGERSGEALRQAGMYVEEILGHLESRTLDGTEEPFLIYLTCYRVLRAKQDPRAQGILDTAHALLQERAAHLDDEEDRRTFLGEVAAHREILAEYGGDEYSVQH